MARTALLFNFHMALTIAGFVFAEGAPSSPDVLIGPLMHEFSRALRIIAAALLIGAGLGLFGALVHTESAIHGPAVAKAKRSHIHAVPESTLGSSHSRHG